MIRWSGSLGRDGQDPGDVVAVLGVVQGGEGEQGVDGGESGVAAAGAVGSVAFQVVQDRGHHRGVEIGEVQSGQRLGGAAVGEQQQHADGVTVGGDGVWAGLSLRSAGR